MSLLRNLGEKVTVIFEKTVFKAKENAPGLLIFGGVACVIGGVVSGCIATTKVDDILDEHDDALNDIHEMDDMGEYEYESDVKHDIVKTHVSTAGKLALNYTPCTLLTISGIGMILASHGIMKKRNAILLSAYEAVDIAFRKYRERVREELGEEEELHFYHGTNKVIEKKKVVGDDGKKSTESIVINEYNEDGLPSPYAKFFDETNDHWCSERQYGPNATEYSMIFLRQTQSWANRILEVRGYIFLNEVYQALGLDMTDVGAITGWVNDGHGDGFVDFGLYEIKRSATRRFVNGIEKSAILLDFNVDGNIIGKIDLANRTLKRGF